MSGFSPNWLALREQADHRSRAPHLAFKIAAKLAGFVNVRIVDLGCGTGSNLRALAPILSNDQYWHLVDYSEDLLAHARILLREWADYAETTSEGMTLYFDEKIIHVRFSNVDLKDGISGLLTPRPDLVTSSAFFDLISADWIQTMAADTARQNILFHTVLSYDGRIGPDSTSILVEAFEKQGYLCETADTPWIIHRNDEPELLDALGTGIGEVVTAKLPLAALQEWTSALEQRRSVLIGHRDLYACPPDKL